MVEILQNKNAASRFQILVEIASQGPNIQQRKIAQRLGITPQAVSDYIHQMSDEGLISVSGRSYYKITPPGVNWMLKVLRELRHYASQVEKAVTNITVCAAIAETDLKKGQRVGLKMRDGLLYATAHIDSGASGIALSDVKKGEDVDISEIQGLVEFQKGRIKILQIPNIQKGGSRNINFELLKKHASNNIIGAIGIESVAALRKLDIEPQYRYGVAEAAVEAARCGLHFVAVCTEEAVPALMQRIQEEALEYELIDLKLENTNKP